MEMLWSVHFYLEVRPCLSRLLLIVDLLVGCLEKMLCQMVIYHGFTIPKLKKTNPSNLCNFQDILLIHLDKLEGIIIQSDDMD